MNRFSLFFCLFSSICLVSNSASESSTQFRIDGTVLELDESNFDAAISKFDYVFVDFYAPWCGHCKRLSPELDLAAPMLAQLDRPIVIVKVNADKFSHLASKYEVDGFPTLKLFIHGVSEEYFGPRKADSFVQYLKKYVAPDVSILESDSAVNNFVETAGVHFPIFIGFGLNELLISKFAIKYKKKAWFSVANGPFEDLMIRYDFDKVPALVSLHPSYDEQSVFYGPFEDSFLEDFIKQNQLPSVLPINSDTLKKLRDDERKVVLTIMEDELNEGSKKLVKYLKAAASANRDLVFGYVGLKQWAEFAETFEVSKKTKLPKVIVWDGNEEYSSVIGSESLDEDDQRSQITRFLEEYRKGKIVKKRISGPSLIGFIRSLANIKTVFLIVFIVGILFLLLTISKDDDVVDDIHGIQTRRSASSGEAYRPEDKQD